MERLFFRRKKPVLNKLTERKPPAKRARAKDVEDDILCSQQSLGGLFSQESGTLPNSPQFCRQDYSPDVKLSPPSPLDGFSQLSLPLTQASLSLTQLSQPARLSLADNAIDKLIKGLDAAIGKLQGRAVLTSEEIAELQESLTATRQHVDSFR